MARYQWNLYEIRNKINQLTTLLGQVTDEKQKIVIMDTITQYHNMLQTVNRKNKNNLGNTETPTSLEHLFNQYALYLSEKDEPLINIILDTYQFIKDFKSKNNTEYLVTFSNEKLLAICYDFFKTALPTSVFKKYEKTLNDIPNHLHIQYSCDNNNGVTYIDPIFKQKYILINRHNEPIDFCVLPHESFHFIFNDYQYYLYSNNPMYYSQEVEGSLANLLFIEYFRTKYSEIAKQLEENFLFYYQMRTISLVILNDYLQSLTDKGKFRKNKFDHYLNYFGFNRPLDIHDIQEIIGFETADDNITYNLSYLASIDLFYIYQKDPEFAFYLLQNIRYVKSNTNVLNVFRNNHITFMDDGFENFKKYIKKIENH